MMSNGMMIQMVRTLPRPGVKNVITSSLLGSSGISSMCSSHSDATSADPIAITPTRMSPVRLLAIVRNDVHARASRLTCGGREAKRPLNAGNGDPGAHRDRFLRGLRRRVSLPGRSLREGG